MNKKNIFKVLFIILCFFLYTNYVKAECTESELNALKELAEQIDYSYELDPNPDDQNVYSYYIDIYNFNNKFYINTNYNGYIFSSQNKENYIMKKSASLKEHQTYIFDIYASNKTKCEGEKLNSINVIVPSFNEYSLRDECKTYQEFYLCRAHYESSRVTDEKFETELNKYKDNLENSKQSIFNTIIEFFVNYYVYFIFLILILAVLIIIKIIINKKKIKINI